MNEKLRLIVDIPSEHYGIVHHAGAFGVVVESLGPNVWLVEIRVPDETLEGDAWYDVLEVRGHEFELIESPETQASATASRSLAGKP